MPMPPNCNEQHTNTGSQCNQQHHHKHVAVPHPQAPNMTRASAKPTRPTRSNNRNPQKANMKRPCTEKIAPIQVRVYTTAGNLVADLHLDEPIVVRKLKNKLVPTLGVSKYRQTLIQDTRVLNDNDKIRKTARLQVVLLNYIPTSTDNIRQLIDASFENSESEVEELLSKPQDVNACLPSTAYPNTANGTTTALQAAASANNTHILKVLFQAHADVNRNGNDRALSHAANQNAEETARILLQHRANPNAAGPNGYTALLCAVAGGHHALATLILAARANPNQGNDTTRTPFGVACHNNDEEMATTLLLARSHVHTPRHPPPHYQYNTTALCAAASANCVSGLKHLLETSIHIDSQLDAPPLWYATWNGRTEVIDFLLEQKANAKQRLLHGGTALSAAAFQGHNTILQKLLHHCKLQSEEDATILQEPLQLAMWSNRPETAKLLIDARANPSDTQSNETLFRIRQLRRYQYTWPLEALLPTIDKLSLYQYLQDSQTQAQNPATSDSSSEQEQEPCPPS